MKLSVLLLFTLVLSMSCSQTRNDNSVAHVDSTTDSTFSSPKIMIFPPERLKGEAAKNLGVVSKWVYTDKVQELSPALHKLLNISPILGFSGRPGGDIRIRVDDASKKTIFFDTIVVDGEVTECIESFLMNDDSSELHQENIKRLKETLKKLDEQQGGQ